VAWEDEGVIREGVEASLDAGGELLDGTAWEVGSADGTGEEGVADEGNVVGFAIEGDAAGGMAWGVEDGEGAVADGECVVVVEEAVWPWAGDGRAAEHAEVEAGIAEPVFFGFVDEDGDCFEGTADVGDAGDVVDVGVGEDEGVEDDAVLDAGAEEVDHVIWLEAGVDDDGVVVGFQDVAVGGVRAWGEGGDGGGHVCGWRMVVGG
jgi:hypothetical protein